MMHLRLGLGFSAKICVRQVSSELLASVRHTGRVNAGFQSFRFSAFDRFGFMKWG